MIATDPIGGPGKGLFQFLKHAPHNAFDYVLCNFDVKQRPFGQFIEAAIQKKLNLILLRQRATIDPGLVVQARRIVMENDINLIQTHGYKSNVIGFCLRWACRRPWIGFAHGYTDDNVKVRLYNRIEQSVLRYADRVVTVSNSMKMLLARQNIDSHKIRMIYNAIDPADAVPAVSGEVIRKRHGLTPDHRILGVIGRLNPEKGQEIFLVSMKKIVERCRNVKALIIGDGQDRERLEGFCQENGLAGSVLFIGYQHNIADYYQILDLLVMPSLSEGLPNTLLEAMSLGVPVLATSVGGVPEVIDKNNGVVVPPNDPDAISDKVIELLGDNSARKLLGAKGKTSLYPRFDPSYRVRRIIDIYDELLSCPLRPSENQ